ncbi:hypothetical protein SDJN03_04067, partial [Cucurbita argyrosperma subsp. sororia]
MLYYVVESCSVHVRLNSIAAMNNALKLDVIEVAPPMPMTTKAAYRTPMRIDPKTKIGVFTYTDTIKEETMRITPAAKPPRDPTMTKKTPEASDSTGLNQKAVLKAIEGEQPVKACHEKAMIPELPIEANNGGKPPENSPSHGRLDRMARFLNLQQQPIRFLHIHGETSS